MGFGAETVHVMAKSLTAISRIMPVPYRFWAWMSSLTTTKKRGFDVERSEIAEMTRSVSKENLGLTVDTSSLPTKPSLDSLQL